MMSIQKELEKILNEKAKGRVRVIRQATKEPQQTLVLISALKDSLQGIVVIEKYKMYIRFRL